MNDSNLSSPEFYLEMWENDEANQAQLITEVSARVGRDVLRNALRDHQLILKSDELIHLAQVDRQAVQWHDVPLDTSIVALIYRVRAVSCPVLDLRASPVRAVDTDMVRTFMAELGF